MASAREIQGCDSSCAIDEHCTRPEAPKIRTPPHVPPAVSCWCEAQRARLGAFRAGAGEQCRARGPWGCIWERLAQARAKRSSGFRAGRGGLRVTLGKRGLPWPIRALNSVEPGPKKTGTVPPGGRYALVVRLDNATLIGAHGRFGLVKGVCSRNGFLITSSATREPRQFLILSVNCLAKTVQVLVLPNRRLRFFETVETLTLW